MLPKVGDTFVKFSLYSKVYKDNKVDKEKGIEAKTATGARKMWFMAGSINLSVFQPLKRWRLKKSAKWLVKETDEYKATYVAVKIKSYSIRTIAKCVSEYLTHESNQQ